MNSGSSIAGQRANTGPGRSRARNKPRVLSCGAVIIRDTPAGRRYLLLRAWGYWDFPKGCQEAGEQALQTALREVQEETALTHLDFRWGKHHSYDTAPYSQNKVARYFVAATDTERVELLPNPESGRVEHDQYAWFDYDQAMAKLTPRVQEVLRWAANVTGHI